MDRSSDALASLVADGVLDGELAALVVLLLGSRVPVIVAAPPAEARDALAAALVAALPEELTPIELAGAAEEFEWLPEAVELGWRRERNVVPATGRDGVPRASAARRHRRSRSRGERRAGDGRRAGPARGPGARRGLRADRHHRRAGSRGRAASASTDRPCNADEDERSRLGVVLAVGEVGRGARVLAAHYVRPVARDQHGHVQRRPPAVLATWNMAGDSFDHFAWGVLPELADRTRRRPVELEREQARLAAELHPGGVRPTG